MSGKLNEIFRKIQEVISKKRVLIIGVGNELKGDDGVGVYIARSLLASGYDKYVINTGIAPENFTSVIWKKSPEVIIIVDAVDFHKKPGSLLFENIENLSEVCYFISTHKLPIQLFSSVIKETLKDVEIFLLGIQPKKTTLGSNLSEEVRESADKLIKFLMKLLRN